MHTPGAQVCKFAHPAAKRCTQGAGCTLNFEHCMDVYFSNHSSVKGKYRLEAPVFFDVKRAFDGSKPFLRYGAVLSEALMSVRHVI